MGSEARSLVWPWTGALALMAVQLAALLLIQSGDPGISGFPLDDAWIHGLVARTLVEHGTLGITPGVYGSGATSTLWALLLSIGELMGIAAPRFAFALNALLLLAAGQLLFALLLRDGVSWPRALLQACAAGLAPNFVWFACSGMEATLVACASIAAIFAWFAGSARAEACAGAALAALALARPEGILLLPLLTILQRPRRIAQWLRLTLPPALVVAAQTLLQLVNTSQLTPSTLAGRRWMWLAPLEGLNGIERVGVLLIDWINRLAEFTLGRLDHWSFWLAAGFAAIGAADAVRAPRQRAVLLWGSLHLAVYAALLPTFGHGGRYQPLLPALFLMLCASGLLQALELALSFSPLPARFRQRIALVAVASVGLLGPGRALLAWRSAHADSVAHVTATEVAMGKKLSQLPASATVASFDIGGIGYFSHRPVLEIGGLSSSALVPLLWQGRVPSYLKEKQVDYLVVPLGLGGPLAQEPWNFAHRLGLNATPWLELEPVSTLSSPLLSWRRGVRASMHCAPRQDLYRVRFAEERAP